MKTRVGALARAVVMAMAVGMMMPAAAQGQLGGLKKKAAAALKRGAGVEAAAPETDVPGGPVRSGNVLTLDEGNLDLLEQALAAEAAERDVVEALLAERPTPDARAACEQTVLVGPQGQAVMADYMAALEKAGENQEAMMKAMQEMDTKLRALYARECGEPYSVEEERELVERPNVVGAAAVGFTPVQYAILKERIAPFCTAGAGVGAGGQGAAVPAEGSNESYVYEAGEVEALRPRCAALMAALPDGGW